MPAAPTSRRNRSKRTAGRPDPPQKPPRASRAAQPPAAVEPPSPVRRWATSPLAAAALLLLYYLNAVGATTGKSNAFDELAHLTAGYTYWVTGEYRMHPENGNLPQRLAGAALLGGGFALPTLSQTDWQTSDVWDFGHQFLFSVNGRRAGEMLLRSRAVMALAGVAVGMVVWLWSRRLFGPAGGMVSLLLFAFSPTMLAHGPLVTSDMTATLFFLLTLGAVWRVLHRITGLTVLAAGLALGGMALAKPSAPVILPMILLLVGWRLAGREPLQLGWWRDTVREQPRRVAWLGSFAVAALAMTGLAMLVVWAGYGFRYAGMLPSPLGGDGFIRPWSWVMEQPDLPRQALKWLADRHWLPEGYLYGTAYALRMADQRSAFLLGQYSRTGWWWFFPYAFLVKTPLPLFAVLALAAAAGWRRWREAGRSSAARRALQALHAAAPLWVLLVVYWTLAIASALNIGHRHLLPTYPALFILAGASGAWLERSTRRMGAAVAVLLLLFVADSAAARPDYLAYFNQTIGSRDNAYRCLVDSSLDWGQDLPGLKRWLDAQRPAPPVYVSYFGTADVGYEGIDATLLSSFVSQGPTPALPAIRGGTFCISATMLQGVYLLPPGPWSDNHEALYQQLRRETSLQYLLGRSPDEQRRLLKAAGNPDVSAATEMYAQLRTSRICAFLRRREPLAEIGHSILIYRLTDDEVRQALEGPVPGPAVE